MTKFINFLNEGRSKSMIEDEALNYIVTKCSNALNSYTYIYRGGRSYTDDFLYLDPSNIERYSAYTPYNYYNLILSNLPSWSKYPKRNESVICTTDMRNAIVYSNDYNQYSYIVFPINGTKIGVCPEGDLWDSFEKSGVSSLEKLNKALKEIKYKHTDNLSDVNWNILKKQLKDIDFIDFIEYWVEFFKKHYIHIIRDISEIDNLYDFIEQILDPKYNGFKLLNIGDDLPLEKEVWFNAPCILVINTEKTLEKINSLKE